MLHLYVERIDRAEDIANIWIFIFRQPSHCYVSIQRNKYAPLLLRNH